MKKSVHTTRKSKSPIKPPTSNDSTGAMIDKMNAEIEEYAKEKKISEETVNQATNNEQVELRFSLPKILWDRLSELATNQHCGADDLIAAGVRLIIEARINPPIGAKARRRRAKIPKSY